MDFFAESLRVSAVRGIRLPLPLISKHFLRLRMSALAMLSALPYDLSTFM